MKKDMLIGELRGSEEYFNRSTRCLEEKHSGAKPAEGMMTAAQQVAHVAQTIDWFLEGLRRPEGFDMDFEAHMREVSKYTSIEKARGWLARSFEAARAYLEQASEADLNGPLPAGPVMGGAPRWSVFSAIVEHTAHHRGALTVYSRVAGLVPALPYMEMSQA